MSAEQYDPPPSKRKMQCRWCYKETLVEDLNKYGARCYSCFEEYCRQPLLGPRIGRPPVKPIEAPPYDPVELPPLVPLPRIDLTGGKAS